MSVAGVGQYCVFFMLKTAYDLRISDWSSGVCSSDLLRETARFARGILRGVILVDFGDFGVGDCGDRHRGAVEQRILDHAAFGHSKLGLVLRQEGLERGVAWVGGRREGARRNEGRLAAALFEEQRGIEIGRASGGEKG